MKKEFKSIFEKYKSKSSLLGILLLKKEDLIKDLNVGHREIESLRYTNKKLRQQYKAMAEYVADIKKIREGELKNEKQILE